MARRGFIAYLSSSAKLQTSDAPIQICIDHHRSIHQDTFFDFCEHSRVGASSRHSAAEWMGVEHHVRPL